MNKYIIVLCLLLSACSTTVMQSNNNFSINEIVIKNSSNIILENVLLKVAKNKGMFSCSNVISRTACSTMFPVRPYEGNWIRISWEKNGKKVSTQNIHIPVGKNIREGSVMKGIIEIQNKNKYSAYFEKQLNTF